MFPAAAATIVGIIAAVFLLRNDADMTTNQGGELYSEVIDETALENNADEPEQLAELRFEEESEGLSSNEEVSKSRVEENQQDSYQNEGQKPLAVAKVKDDAYIIARDESDSDYDKDMFKGDLNTEYTPPPPVVEVQADVVEDVAEDMVEMEADSYSANSAPAESASTAPLVRKKKASATRAIDNVSVERLKGIVLDENSLPLIGAQVQYGDEFVMTDVDGAFEFKTAFLKGNMLNVTYIGYEDKSYELSSSNVVTIEMDISSDSLSEVVVSTNTGALKSQPEMGYEALEEYIEKNKMRTKASNENNISGIVKLRFNVNKTGEPVRIKVISGLGFGLDKEAIRLLESTKWTPGKNNEIEIEF